MAGLVRTNFRGLKKVLMARNHVVNVNTVHRFVNLSTFRKTFSERNVSTHLGKRKFCTQIAESSEATMEEDKFSRKEEQSTSEIFEEIAAGDPQRLKKLKMLEFEVAVLREEEQKVPDKISKSQWEALLETESASLRKKYLAFYRLNELKNKNLERRSVSRREFFQKLKEQQGFHYYGLSGHTMFMRIYEKQFLTFLYQRLMYQKLLNSKLEILLDCSFQEYMSEINLKLCAKQVAHCLTLVRSHKYPCSFSLFNLCEGSRLQKLLPHYTKTVFECPITEVHTGSYLDHYPKERLIYLSPHAKNELKYFNHNDVFIIGAYVDKGTSLKVSLAKAKEQNLRMAKLPIDEYLVWKQGTKSLPFCTVLHIILDMAYYDDWRIAFKHIPKRCIRW